MPTHAVCDDVEIGIARYFVERGYRAILSCVDTEQLDGAFCGRDFDAALLAELPDRVDPCGENGEFHTCVHAGPIFASAIALERGERVLRDGRFQYVDLIEAQSPGDSHATTVLGLELD